MSFRISWISGPGNYSEAIRGDRADLISANFTVNRGDFWIFGPGHYATDDAVEMQEREQARTAGPGRGYIVNINRPGRADQLSRVESDRKISFVWEPGDAVVVQDDRDDAMSYRIGGNRKAGYTLYHCGARPPHRKTGMPLGLSEGPHPTLRDAICSLVHQFKSDWRYLGLHPVSGYRPYYGSHRGWELLYRRVCEARVDNPPASLEVLEDEYRRVCEAPVDRPSTGREWYNKPRRVLPPHLRYPLPRADAAADLAEELERAEKAAMDEDVARGEFS